MAPKRDAILAARRSFHLVQAVMAGCTTRSEIEAYIRAAMPQDELYIHTNADKQWQHDRDRVPTLFGVNLHYDPVTKTNQITDLEPHGWVALPPSALQTLVLLRETFREDAPFHQEVTELLNLLVALLPANQRDMVNRRRNVIALNLHSLDSDDIPATLFEQVQIAVNQRQLVRFDYLSPRRVERIALTHTVEPYSLDFEDGHWYLFGYRRKSENPTAKPNTSASHHQFRLTAIIPDSLVRLSEKVAPRPEISHRLVYWLHSDLTRGGISHRFPHSRPTATREIDEVVWTELTATITPSQEFRAAQLFLRYGNKCCVVEPESLRKKIVELVRRLAEVYLENKEEF